MDTFPANLVRLIIKPFMKPLETLENHREECFSIGVEQFHTEHLCNAPLFSMTAKIQPSLTLRLYVRQLQSGFFLSV